MIEELLQSEDLIKSREKLKALLHHADRLHTGNLPHEEKERTIERMKALAGIKKPKQQKAAANPASTQSHDTYHPDFQHLNVSRDMWHNLTPKMKKDTHEFHKEVLAGKHPDVKLKKSLESLFKLFTDIKGHLS